MMSDNGSQLVGAERELKRDDLGVESQRAKRI